MLVKGATNIWENPFLYHALRMSLVLDHRFMKYRMRALYCRKLGIEKKFNTKSADCLIDTPFFQFYVFTSFV